MKRFIEGEDRSQSTLFPEHLDDYIAEDNPVRVIDVFVDGLDLNELGFEGAEAEVTGRPAYHPASLLKIYIYGYLNRIQSSRRLERESQRNVDGSDSLLDQEDPACQYRDEFACPRLQPKTRDAGCRNRTARVGNESLNSPFCCIQIVNTVSLWNLGPWNRLRTTQQ